MLRGNSESEPHTVDQPVDAYLEAETSSQSGLTQELLKMVGQSM